MTLRTIKKFFKNRRRNREIDPDQIFLDSSNLPDFDVHQFEGRIEKPIPQATLVLLGIVFALVGAGYLSKVWNLQVTDGIAYAEKSQKNRLRHTTIFSERGVIYDRNKKLLASNKVNPDNPDFALREYIDAPGFAHVLGYVRYPKQDRSGLYYAEQYEPQDGVEKMYNTTLGGKNGVKIIETDALGAIVSENVIEPPRPGNNITLTIDADLQEMLYRTIKKTADQVGFTGGAAGIMNIHTGEMLAVASYPEYDPDLLSNGKDVKRIQALFNNPNNPFLDRFVEGLYTPGSIVKPIVALAALNEGTISPNKKILSTGSISIPNIYDPTKSTIFRDWKAHGWVDMREAISVSSDVYFYAVGGGYEDQKGLGVTKIDDYMRRFGFGEKVDSPFFAGKKGTIPTPEWKKQVFNGEEWRVGDTYNTSIGQYGFQVTPIQMLVATAAIANDGTVTRPTLIKGDASTQKDRQTIAIPQEHFKVVKEGMRMGAISGTAKALNIPGVNFAAKTGTAELGSLKKYVNSWVVGFYPYEKPEYAFVFIMERGPATNLVGASSVARDFFEWMTLNHSSHFQF